MKTDKLDQFVRENAEGFNNLDPPAMAWDTIERELPVARKPKIRRLWPYAWKVAAAVLIFATAWMLNDFTEQGGTRQIVSMDKATSGNPDVNELQDAEAYYASQIIGKQAELAKFASEHPEIIADLKREFVEMDKKKAVLKSDLKESNADEKVIEAIILSYRMKIEILDDILHELRKSDGDRPDEKPADKEL